MRDVVIDRLVLRNWLRRNTRLVLLAAFALVLALLSLTGGLEGLTTYVAFLGILFTSGLARRLGRLLRVPEFGTGVELGGCSILLLMSATAWANRSDSVVYPWDLYNYLLVAGAVAYCTIWTYHTIRGARFWQQFALAAGTSVGSVCIFVWIVFLGYGVVRIPEDCVLPIVLGPLTFVVAWLPCFAIVLVRDRRNERRLAGEAGDGQQAPGPLRSRITAYFALPPKPRGTNPFQFSLRSILLLTLVVGLLAGGLRTKFVQIQRQQAAMARLGGSDFADRYDFRPGVWVPWWLDRIFGDPLAARPYVDVRREWIADADLDYLHDFINEISLSLSGGFTDESLQRVGRVHSIWRLEVRDSPVTDAGLVHLKDLPALEELWLSDTAITDAGLERIASWKNLTVLKLCASAGITDAGMEQIGKMRNLYELRLCRTAITDDGLRHLSGLSNLRTLDLAGTRITGAGLEHITHLESLDVLRLSNTQLTDEDVGRLEALNSERTFILLDGTNVTEHGIGKLNRRLPNECRASFHW